MTWRIWVLLAAGVAASTFAPASAKAQRLHIVRRGQSWARIAKRHRVSVWNLALANGARPSERLRPGRALRVPPRSITFVKPGQTLSHIARRHGCPVSQLSRLNRIRRGRVRIGQRLRLPGYERIGTISKRSFPPPEDPGKARLLRRQDRSEHAIRLVDPDGRITADGLFGLGRLMRRREEDPVALPHPRLVLLLAAISDHFGGLPITIVSGRRPVGGYTRGSSRHVAGRALDLRVHDVPNRLVWEYCRSLRNTGCGYYPRSTFVHVDVRNPHAQWVDWSRPGKRPRYGSLRRPYRRRHRRRLPRVGRSLHQLSDDVPVEWAFTDAAQALWNRREGTNLRPAVGLSQRVEPTNARGNAQRMGSGGSGGSRGSGERGLVSEPVRGAARNGRVGKRQPPTGLRTSSGSASSSRRTQRASGSPGRTS